MIFKRSKGGWFLLVLGLCLYVLPGFSLAATTDPPSELVKVQVIHSLDAYPQGGTYLLALKLTIAPGYHLNSNRPKAPEELPTWVRFYPPQGIKLSAPVFPAPQDYKSPISGEASNGFGGSILLRTSLSVAPDISAGPHRIKVALGYQGCTGLACLLPEEKTFVFAIKVAPAGKPGQGLNPEIFEKK